MKISDLLDVVQDDTVSIRETDLISSERITELTIMKLRAETSESARCRRKPRKSSIAAIVAAACLVLSVTASASGLFGRTVNWKGRPVRVDPEIPQPFETIPPDTAMMGNESLDEVIASILAQREERELMIVRHGGSASSIERTAAVSSVEELKELLAGEDSLLTVPISIPPEYRLITGRVSYESKSGYGYTLRSVENRADGLVVERYTAPPEGDFICGFMLEYENEEGKKLCLMGYMVPDSQAEFGVPDGGTVYSLHVNGMDDALGIKAVEGGRSSFLYLRQRLSPPVVCESRDALMGSPTDTTEYGEIHYSVSGAGWSVEELQALLVF